MIVGGLDVHRKQITYEYVDTITGEVKRGQIAPADRAHLRAWLARFDRPEQVAFAVEACTGWRYVAEELAAAGIAVHLAEPADTAALRGRKRHAKTDRTDSRLLRAHALAGDLPECWVPPSHILECRALLETGQRERGDRAPVDRIGQDPGAAQVPGCGGHPVPHPGQLVVQSGQDPQAGAELQLPGRREATAGQRGQLVRGIGPAQVVEDRGTLVEQHRVHPLHPAGVLGPQVVIQIADPAGASRTAG